MKVAIETDPLVVTIDGKEVYSEKEKPKENIGDKIIYTANSYHGVQEYGSTVSAFITWFYGYMSKVSWCAIFVCYVLDLCSRLAYIGGKADNVNTMRENCIDASHKGLGSYFCKGEIPRELKKGDILFWLWDGGTMTHNSNKHVGFCEYDTSDDTIYCLGGNQKDKVCTLAYDRKYLYAVYRIH